MKMHTAPTTNGRTRCLTRLGRSPRSTSGLVARRGVFLFACTSLAFYASPAQAADDAAGQIDEIQVTATRRPVQVENVSAALTVIHADKIRGSKLTTDALAMEPGIFLQQTTPGQGAAIVRGLKGSEILHLVDGFRLNNAIFRNAPTQYLALVAPGSSERIEVVRGAPASLYGSDAAGGVVQVLSRVPAFDSAGSRGSAYVAYDSADLGKIARASFEKGDERVAGLLDVAYLDTGNRRIGGGERIAPSDYSANGARLAVSATPDASGSWLLDLQFARQPLTPRTDEMVPGFGQTEPSSEEFYFAPNDRVFAHLCHARKDWLGSADLTVDAGWQRIVDDRISRDFGSSLRRHEENSSDLFGLAINVATSTDQGSWIVGIDLYYDEVASSRSEEDIVTGQVQAVLPRFPDGSTMSHAALYGNLMRNVGDRHTVSGGLRFSSIDTDLGPASSGQDDVSADIGWTLDVTDQIQLTANAGYGFRAPNVFDLGTLGERPGNRFNIPNPNLESEHITQFDTGLRRRGETWDFELTVFALHYTGRIASVMTGAVTMDGREIVQARNVSSADIRGVETYVRADLSEFLSAELVVNYLRGEQAEEDGTETPGDRIPPLNGRLTLRYRAGDALLVEPYVFFAGAQHRLSPRDVQDTRINPAGTPGWATANVAFAWQPDDRWRLIARFENIFDKRYRMHGSGIDATGRNLVLGAQYTW